MQHHQLVSSLQIARKCPLAFYCASSCCSSALEYLRSCPLLEVSRAIFTAALPTVLHRGAQAQAVQITRCMQPACCAPGCSKWCMLSTVGQHLWENSPAASRRASGRAAFLASSCLLITAAMRSWLTRMGLSLYSSCTPPLVMCCYALHAAVLLHSIAHVTSDHSMDSVAELASMKAYLDAQDQAVQP